MNQNFYDMHNGKTIKKVYEIREVKFSGIFTKAGSGKFDRYENGELVESNVDPM